LVIPLGPSGFPVALLLMPGNNSVSVICYIIHYFVVDVPIVCWNRLLWKKVLWDDMHGSKKVANVVRYLCINYIVFMLHRCNSSFVCFSPCLSWLNQLPFFFLQIWITIRPTDILEENELWFNFFIINSECLSESTFNIFTISTRTSLIRHTWKQVHRILSTEFLQLLAF
jgi:hypothetical protein